MNFELSDAHKAALSTLSPEDQKLVLELWTAYSPAEVPESRWLSMTSPQRVAYFSPYARSTALSKRHHAEQQEKLAKIEAKAAAKAEKEALKAKKLAEKELLSKMSPAERKEFKKRQKLQKEMDAQGAPTLGI